VAAKSQVATQNAEREEKDKQRLKNCEILIASVFEIIAKELTSQMNTMTVGITQNFAERSSPVPEGSEQADKWEGINEHYERFFDFYQSPL
jgi:hypothetical protein